MPLSVLRGIPWIRFFLVFFWSWRCHSIVQLQQWLPFLLVLFLWYFAPIVLFVYLAFLRSFLFRSQPSSLLESSSPQQSTQMCEFCTLAIGRRIPRWTRRTFIVEHHRIASCGHAAPKKNHNSSRDGHTLTHAQICTLLNVRWLQKKLKQSFVIERSRLSQHLILSLSSMPSIHAFAILVWRIVPNGLRNSSFGHSFRCLSDIVKEATSLGDDSRNTSLVMAWQGCPVVSFSLGILLLLKAHTYVMGRRHILVDVRLDLSSSILAQENSTWFLLILNCFFSTHAPLWR